MFWQKKNRFTIVAISFFLFLVITGLKVSAENITFREALEWGKEHNYELQGMRDEIKGVKRKISAVMARLGWQFSLSGKPIYNKDYHQSETDPFSENFEGSVLELKLSGNKNFLSGLSLSSNISLTEIAPLQFEELEDDLELVLNLSKRLYPRIPVQEEQDLYILKNDLAAARENLKQEKYLKEVSWIKSYLNLLRLKERLELTRLNLDIARGNLKRVLKQQVIGEAGKEQVLDARIELKEARLKFSEVDNNLNREKAGWYQELGLSSEILVVFTEDNRYLMERNEWLDKQSMTLDNRDKLMISVKGNSPRFRVNKLKYELVQKQLKWQKEKGKIQLNALASYDYQKDQGDGWEIGLNLNYKLTDGGQQKLAEEDLQNQLNGLEQDSQQIVKELQLQLTDLLSSYETAVLNLETEKLKLKKAKLKRELAQEQYKQGLVSLLTYQQEKIKEKEIRIDCRAAADKLFISKLKLAQFIGLY